MIFEEGFGLPLGWARVHTHPHGEIWENAKRGLVVQASLSKKSDGKRWLQLVISRPYKLPGFKDMAYVKRHFLGDDRRAIEDYPDRAHSVAGRVRGRTLFSCLDKGWLPEL